MEEKVNENKGVFGISEKGGKGGGGGGGGLEKKGRAILFKQSQQQKGGRGGGGGEEREDVFVGLGKGFEERVRAYFEGVCLTVFLDCQVCFLVLLFVLLLLL